MNIHYDVEGAAKKLEGVTLDRYDSPHSGIQLSRFLSVASSYEVLASGKVWKLVQKTGDHASEAYEEVNAIFQGVITKHDLPPFTEKPRNVTQAKYLRQSVTVSGLGIPAFNKIVDVVSEIHLYFARTIGLNRVEDCTFVATNFDTEALEIELSNRYFEYRSKNSGSEVPLTKDIDPHGYLAEAMGTKMYHSEENTVAYFVRHGVSDEDYRYEQAKPIVFSPGDIVEVHVTFVAVPLKNDKFKTMAVLRGLTLIDDSFVKKARSLQLSERSAAHALKPKISLKRKIAYHAERVSVTRAKLERMAIDTSPGANENEDINNVEKELMPTQGNVAR